MRAESKPPAEAALDIPQTEMQAHWQKVDAHVRAWLAERQELISLLCAIRSADESDDEMHGVESRISSFCDVLIDYISAAHFEIYSDLVREAEYYDDQSLALLTRVMPSIAESTEAAMAFNDLFGNGELDEDDIGPLLTVRLSALAEKLEDRFELEDLLIEKVHYAHAA